jgi:DNA polymerase
MKFLTLDFETYYDKEYSLRKLTPPEYILDVRYETICLAAQVDDGAVDFIDGPDVGAWLAQFAPADTITLTFNALFDNCILAWRYGWVPARMIDGLGMARCLLGHKLRRLSLDAVSKHLNAGEKGDAVHTVVGMRRQDIINAGLWQTYAEYNKQDVRILRTIFNKLAPAFPKAEYRLMDLVLRCAIQPQFVVDLPRLEAHLVKVRADKLALMQAAGVEIIEKDGKHSAPQLASTDGFARLLENLGVVVSTKMTKTGNEIPALAKTDEFMNELLEHEDPMVQAVAAARLGVKSTLEEARTERFIKIAKLDWPIAGLPACTMPIALRFAGAHTQRLSGEWKINQQNLPSGRDGKDPALRLSLLAPPGYECVVGDLAQVEARITAWFTRATVLLEAFAHGEDVYKVMAAEIFGITVAQVTDLQRFCGKEAVLGLGFGLAAANFFIKTAAKARALGMNLGDFWTLQLAKDVVRKYRHVNHPTVTMWELLEQHLHGVWSGLNDEWAVLGPISIGPGSIEGPGGLRMLYETDVERAPGRDLWYSYGGKPRKIYGAAALENIVQFLARIVQMNAALRLAQRGLRMAHTVHDELAFIVRKENVDETKRIVLEEMTRRPSWAPTLPLKAEVGSGLSYGESK